MKFLSILFLQLMITTSLMAQWNLHANGTDAYYSLSGNVGIGTATPGSKLHVVGQIRGYTQFHLGDGYDVNGRGLTIDNTGSTSWDFMNLRNTNGTQFRITGSGLVGIGTPSPQSTLQIGSGTSSVSFSLRGLDGVAAANAIYFEDSQGQASQWFRLTNNTIDNRLTFSSFEQSQILSMARATGNVGIGVANPIAKLQILENGRYYYVDRKIAGQTSSENSTGKNYILLHPFYTGTAMNDSYVMGKITAVRGGVSSWNRKITVEVNTASAYMSNRGSIISYNEPAKLVTVVYNTVTYLALEIQSNSGVSYLSFTGYANNDNLELVFDDAITGTPVDFLPTDPVYMQGNLAVGTISPLARFQSDVGMTSTNDVAAIVYGTTNNTSFSTPGGTSQKRATFIVGSHWNDGNGSAGALANFYNTSGSKFYVRADGKVGINTAQPDEALTVKGKIHTEEVRVDLTVPAPDYVFAPDYNLLPLSEVESYIKANKHLPEVPSAKQMEEEGLNLKEMNLLLLKKVEELTLHLIELKKENEEIKKEIRKGK